MVTIQNDFLKKYELAGWKGCLEKCIVYFLGVVSWKTIALYIQLVEFRDNLKPVVDFYLDIRTVGYQKFLEIDSKWNGKKTIKYVDFVAKSIL